MKLKKAMFAMLLAGAVSIPVLAINGPSTGHPVSTSVAFWNSSEFGVGAPPPGIFANWITQDNHTVLAFGSTADNDDVETIVGVRVSGSTGPARNFQMTCNKEGGIQPGFIVYTVPPGATGGTFFKSFPAASSNFLSTKNLNNGYTQYTYNAARNGVPSGSTFSTIYFVDSNYPVVSQTSLKPAVISEQAPYCDFVRDIYVNGSPAVANVQPYPEFDCNLDY